MTTPDTLASLIAKWRKYSDSDARGDAEDSGYDEPIGTYMHGQRLTCAHELEAALDALAERLERYSQIQSNRAVAEAYLACVAELRERGAAEPKAAEGQK